MASCVDERRGTSGVLRPRPCIATELPEGVYRDGKLASQSKDIFFPLLEPILAFGGVTSYFLIAIAAVKKRYGIAAAMSFVQMVSLKIGNSAENTSFLKSARSVYLTMARRALPMLHYLDPVPPHQGATRPRVLFLLPHGLFCIAGKRYCSESTVAGRQPGMSFFVDDKLCTLSPMMKASARMCGATKIYPVGDKHVRTAMDKGENCCVFPGGFVEASCTSRACLRVYTGVYGYWVARALQYGYDIEVVLIYHGSEVWDQGEGLFESRLALAKKGMPGILPTHPSRTPLAVREIFYPWEEQKAGSDELADSSRELASRIIKDVVDAYENDAARVLEVTGKPLKRLEIIGKPLTGELPSVAQKPKGRSSMSRL